MIKKRTSDTFNELSWFHGGDIEFCEWQIPPPARTAHKLLMNYSFVFLTTDRHYATKSGTKLAVAALHNDYWHEGWVSGNVFKYAWENVDLDHHFQSEISRDCEQFDIGREEMNIIFSQNLTRSLIEYICRCALDLGYDGLFGHERDENGIAQPVLAIFREKVLSSPVWIQQNGYGDLII